MKFIALHSVAVMTAVLLPALCLLEAQVTKPAEAIKAKVVLIELFTSEGCSSCPPADALLQKINGTRSDDNQIIVALSEHVTYWDSLGWKDPFSASIYTDRQNAYSAKFGLDSVYTPQMVVNGAQQFVGSDQAALKRALKKEATQSTPFDLHILYTTIDKETLTVKFSVAGDKSAKGDIIAVLTDDIDHSNVLHGENSGRKLSHVAVARSMTHVAKINSAEEQTVQVPLPATVQQSPGRHLILFAQSPSSGHILAVDTRPY